MAEQLRWGIIGTGNIANTFARGLAHSETGELFAVGSRSQASADDFGVTNGASRCHGSYDALLADEDVDAVYVATPHPFHAEWAVKAARAGKHVLCEKPLGMNVSEAQAVIDAARESDVFLMEAFMYRCHPQTHRLIGLIREGTIGEVRVIYAAFSFHARWNPAARLFSKEYGGGGILDVGCYCTSMSRLIAGVATGQDFAEPLDVHGCGHLGESGVDEWAVASLRFPGDILAQVSTGVSVRQDNAVRVFGTEGSIVVPIPWIPNREGGTSTILVYKGSSAEPEEIVVETDQWLYAMEADTVAANLERRQPTPPAVTWEDTLGNMRTLDRWRASIGLAYDADGS
jgi:predicted dehydrogenase